MKKFSLINILENMSHNLWIDYKDNLLDKPWEYIFFNFKEEVKFY